MTHFVEEGESFFTYKLYIFKHSLFFVFFSISKNFYLDFGFLHTFMHFYVFHFFTYFLFFIDFCTFHIFREKCIFFHIFVYVFFVDFCIFLHILYIYKYFLYTFMFFFP